MRDAAVARLLAVAAVVLALAACDEPPPQQHERVALAAPAAARTMPATAWAPQAPYSEARLSPFDAAR